MNDPREVTRIVDHGFELENRTPRRGEKISADLFGTGRFVDGTLLDLSPRTLKAKFGRVTASVGLRKADSIWRTISGILHYQAAND